MQHLALFICSKIIILPVVVFFFFFFPDNRMSVFVIPMLLSRLHASNRLGKTRNEPHNAICALCYVHRLFVYFVNYISKSKLKNPMANIIQKGQNSSSLVTDLCRRHLGFSFIPSFLCISSRVYGDRWSK